MYRFLPWDRQCAKILMYCNKCGGEIYENLFFDEDELIFPGGLCRDCYEEEQNGQPSKIC